MSSTSAPSRSRTGLWLKLALLAVVAGLLGWLLWRGVDLRGWVHRGTEWVRGLGPLPFFGAMAVLPAVGFPISAFTLSVGPIFGPTLGVPLVIVLTALAQALNLTLAYWLSRYALRPWIARLLRWMGYSLPEVSPRNRLGVTMLVRLTPGPPYFLQSFVLGLVAIPFRVYLVVSWVVAMAYSLAFILFGDSIAKGDKRSALLALGLLFLIGTCVAIVRRRMMAREARNEA